jgi:repressor LexA
VNRDVEVCRAVVRLTEQRGYPPSVREIGRAVGLRSTSTVQSHIDTCKRRGWLLADRGIPRSIRLTEEGLEAIG